MEILKGLILLLIPGVFCSVEEEIPPWVKCPQDGMVSAFFPHACDCSKFYQCSNTRPIELSCSPPLHWNQDELTCDWAQFGDCKNPTCEDDHSITYEMNYRHCNYYYQCVNGVPQCLRCPTGLHWNNVQFQCEEPCTAGCKEGMRFRKKRSSEITLLKTTKSFSCPVSESNYTSSFEDPENCRAFYTCTNGVVARRMCPVGLYFNSVKSTCDFRRNLNCQLVESECETSTIQ